MTASGRSQQEVTGRWWGGLSVTIGYGLAEFVQQRSETGVLLGPLGDGAAGVQDGGVVAAAEVSADLFEAVGRSAAGPGTCRYDAGCVTVWARLRLWRSEILTFKRLATISMILGTLMLGGDLFAQGLAGEID